MFTFVIRNFPSCTQLPRQSCQVSTDILKPVRAYLSMAATVVVELLLLILHIVLLAPLFVFWRPRSNRLTIARDYRPIFPSLRVSLRCSLQASSSGVERKPFFILGPELWGLVHFGTFLGGQEKWLPISHYVIQLLQNGESSLEGAIVSSSYAYTVTRTTGCLSQAVCDIFTNDMIQNVPNLWLNATNGGQNIFSVCDDIFYAHI